MLLADYLREQTALGDCYEANARFLVDKFLFARKNADDFRLVHGIAIGQEGSPIDGLEFGHCWIEHKKNEVWDFSNGRNIKMPKEVYYLLGKIDPNKTIKYKIEDIRNWLLKSKHWGPWELQAPR